MPDEVQPKDVQPIQAKSPVSTSQPVPRKWWQWALLYPTLIVSLLAAIPTITEAYKSIILGVGFGKSEEALEQRRLWERNLDCAQSPYDYLKTASNYQVDATICISGDVLVRVVTPDNNRRYKWVAVAEFAPQRSSSFNLIGSAFANESDEALMLTQLGGIQTICQRFLDQVMLLRRVSVPGQGCWDEIVNTLNGMVVRRNPAPCNPQC